MKQASFTPGQRTYFTQQCAAAGCGHPSFKLMSVETGFLLPLGTEKKERTKKAQEAIKALEKTMPMFNYSHTETRQSAPREGYSIKIRMEFKKV